MDYSSIIKKSWEYLKKHRYFWWLGLLAFFSSGGSGATFYNIPFNYPTENPSVDQNQGPVLSDVLSKIRASENALITNNTTYLLIFGVIALILFVAIIYISTSANAGLIFAVNSLERRVGEINLKKAFHSGQRYFWRFFVFNLLLGAMAITFIGLLSLPVILLFSEGSSLFSGIAIFYILVGIIILFLGMILVSMVKVIGERLIVIENLKVLKAMKQTFLLVRNNFGKVIITLLIEFGLNVVISIGIMFTFLIVFGIGALIFYLLSLLNTIVAMIFAGLIMLALLVALVVIRSGVIAFISSFWTISYLAIDYLFKKKLVSSSSK
jgi:hypothetical protein